eukprot:Skav235730  [mRNA]  locus=scaffold1686:9544:24745:- [translate_table: standard]
MLKLKVGQFETKMELQPLQLTEAIKKKEAEKEAVERQLEAAKAEATEKEKQHANELKAAQAEKETVERQLKAAKAEAAEKEKQHTNELKGLQAEKKAEAQAVQDNRQERNRMLPEIKDPEEAAVKLEPQTKNKCGSPADIPPEAKEKAGGKGKAGGNEVKGWFRELSTASVPFWTTSMSLPSQTAPVLATTASRALSQHVHAGIVLNAAKTRVYSHQQGAAPPGSSWSRCIGLVRVVWRWLIGLARPCLGEIMSFKGDNINGFDPKDRKWDPERLLLGYWHSAATLNFLRGYAASGDHAPLQTIDAHIEYFRGIANPIGVKVGIFDDILTEITEAGVAGGIGRLCPGTMPHVRCTH